MQFARELSNAVAEYRAHTFAEGTIKTYKSHLTAYMNFCKNLGIAPVPVTDQVAAMYAAHLAKTLKPASVRQYVNIIRLLHLECGYDNPCKDSWFLTSTLKGIDRVKGTLVASKAPVTPAMLLDIYKQLDFEKRPDCVFWAACLVMFFGLLRRSNVLADSGKFDPLRQLTRDSVLICDDQSLTLIIRWSKTIQLKDRVLRISVPLIAPHPLCPVSAVVKSFRKTSPAEPSDPAFPMSCREFNRRLRHLLGGRSDISSHSLRRGGACHALACSFPTEIIKALGDWKSAAYLKYVDQVPDNVLNYFRVRFAQALPTL